MLGIIVRRQGKRQQGVGHDRLDLKVKMGESGSGAVAGVLDGDTRFLGLDSKHQGAKRRYFGAKGPAPGPATSFLCSPGMTLPSLGLGLTFCKVGSLDGTVKGLLL